MKVFLVVAGMDGVCVAVFYRPRFTAARRWPILDNSVRILFRWRPFGRTRESMASEPSDFRKGLSYAMRIGVELISALAVGGGLGYLADWYFGTSPWLIVVG